VRFVGPDLAAELHGKSRSSNSTSAPSQTLGSQADAPSAHFWYRRQPAVKRLRKESVREPCLPGVTRARSRRWTAQLQTSSVVPSRAAQSTTVCPSPDR
jgi:hypothetical protein